VIPQHIDRASFINLPESDKYYTIYPSTRSAKRVMHDHNAIVSYKQFSS